MRGTRGPSLALSFGRGTNPKPRNAYFPVNFPRSSVLLFGMSQIIQIDGSLGEGGGQVLRTSLALALLLGKPFHLRHIRAGRAKPGLQAQHLMSVQAAGRIGKANLRGASLRSTDLTFEPDDIQPGEYCFTIGTAGATALVLHTIYLPLALAKSASHVVIEGGTHVMAAPCFDFLRQTWGPYLRALGIVIDLRLDRVGFYPRGGGRLEAHIKPASEILGFNGLTTPTITDAVVHVGIAGLPDHVGDRLAERAGAGLVELGLNVTTQRERWTGGPGCMVGATLPTQPAATFLFALGEKGKSAERVADELVTQVRAYLQVQPIGVGVDEHSADQLLLPLVFAKGPSRFRVARVSSHLLTNIAVIGYFCERQITCDAPEGEPGVVTVE